MENNKKLNYRFIAFGAFPSLQANDSNVIKKLYNVFEGENFIPNIVNDVLRNGNGEVKIEERIFLKFDYGCSIVVGTEQIEITLCFEEQSPYNDLSDYEIILMASNYFSKIVQNFDCKVNRLALVTINLVEGDTANNLERKITNIKNNMTFYKNKDLKEWYQRLVTIEKNEEINEDVFCNAFFNKTSGNVIKDGKKEPFSGVIINLDINTVPENKIFRFDSKNIKLFLEGAIALKKNLENNI